MAGRQAHSVWQSDERLGSDQGKRCSSSRHMSSDNLLTLAMLCVLCVYSAQKVETFGTEDGKPTAVIAIGDCGQIQ